MKTLKQFLAESSGLSAQKVGIDYLNKYCSKSIWMSQRDTPIWRGDTDISDTLSQNGGIMVVDTMKTTRKSINTKNYYTLIFDYIFSTSMTQFPLRSKSIVCSTSKVTAGQYGDEMIVIPTDNAKIGFINKDDIWGIKPPSPVKLDDLQQLNLSFFRCGIPEDIDSIKNWFNAKTYDTSNKDIVEMHKMFPSFDRLVDYYKKIIVKHFKPYTSANVPVSGDHELWISGDVVLIDSNFWHNHIQRAAWAYSWELK